MANSKHNDEKIYSSLPISTDDGLSWFRYISVPWENETSAGITQRKIAHIEGLNIE